MNFAGFLGTESGTCVVAGCGKSLNDLVGMDLPDVVAVNDACAAVEAKYLVVVNDRSTFPPHRWRSIQGTSAKVVFTHLGALGINDESKVCTIPLGSYGGADLNRLQVDFTSNSPYVACVIAYKLGYRNIGLIGVDFTDGHFNHESGRHSLFPRLNSIDSEYMTLRLAMERNGARLVNISEQSLLKSLQKVPFREFIAGR